ncbi:uncharacterized protein LOC119440435 [Dermacentor silvarum]|uniref:uncharacterized protein LOC119440435 n=1 Tax=Dermacentor silvarum TaxID=543639 RepID=UPI001898E58C|nr:uncharacterized protein LOC119440435 [Dermacentor silvarum]
MVIDPRDQGVRLKLYWLLHGVPDDDVRVALAPFGKVTEISRDKWKVKGCIDKGSTTRSVTLKLKVGVTVDDLPHQLRVAEDMALVFVPGRAPLCLRCRGTGHIRRECRVPRCGICRRFGHDDSQCVRSYASVTGPLRSDVVSEHLMDAADAEEASREYNDGAKTAATPPEASSGAVQEANGGAEPSAAASETMPETTTDDAEIEGRKHVIVSSARRRPGGNGRRDAHDRKRRCKAALRRLRQHRESECVRHRRASNEGVDWAAVFGSTEAKVAA